MDLDPVISGVRIVRVNGEHDAVNWQRAAAK
jgi:hypothetical protein